MENNTGHGRPPQQSYATLRELDQLQDRVKRLEQHCETAYVTQQEFRPIRSGFYFVAAVITTAVLGALMTFLLKT